MTLTLVKYHFYPHVKKRPNPRRLVYTLSNNTLFNIGVNPDVKIDVKFEAHGQECVVSKG